MAHAQEAPEIPVTVDDVQSVLKHTPYYKPNDNCGGPSTSTSGTSLYMIGDSIANGAQAQLNTALRSKNYTNITINGKDSRRLSEGNSDLDGISVLGKDGPLFANAGTVIIALGTNGDINEANISKTINAVKLASSGAKIYWVNIGVDNTKRNGTPINNDALNAILQQNTAKGYTVIDWSTQVKQHPEYIDPNPVTGLGVHPVDETAKQAFANTVANGLAAGGVIATSQGGGCACSTNALVGDGTLPDSVPQPYHDIFIAAGAKHGIEPAAIAAIFSVGEHGGSWPTPPPPYGNGPRWASRAEPGISNPTWTAEFLDDSSPNVGLKGSVGSAQFLFGTWLLYKDDGNGDGRMNAEDLTDASFAEAKFLVTLGAKKGADDNALKKAFGDYNGSGANGSYAARVFDYYKQLLSGGGSGINGAAGSGGIASCGAGGIVAGDIVKTALGLAWPTKQAQGRINKADATPAYQDAMSRFNGSQGDDPFSDCGVFVATVLIASGADINYPKRGTTIQQDYVRSHLDKYQVTENVTSSDQLQPGDILINSAHTMIFTGAQGNGFNAVDASIHDRVPGAEIFFVHPAGPWTVARLKK